MGTTVAIILTLAGLALALASVIYARKQLHLQLRPRRDSVLTFDVRAASPGRYRVTAKNGGDATARHVRAWLRVKESEVDVTDPNREIGSLIPGETVVEWLHAPAVHDGATLKLWYRWETVDHKICGPKPSAAQITDAKGWTVDDFASGPAETDVWSLAFLFDRTRRSFRWGRDHATIYDQLGVTPGHHSRKQWLAGRLLNDWAVEIYDQTCDQEEREEVDRMAVAEAPRDAVGELFRLDETSL